LETPPELLPTPAGFKSTMFSLLILQFGQISELSGALSESPLLALATLFVAGLLTSLTPCIYPMIPITASVISGTSKQGQSKGRTLGLTLTYVVGMSTLYAFLGLLAGMSGTLFGSVSANPWALLAVGNLLFLFSLFMLDAIPVPIPRQFMDWAGSQGGGSYGAVFLLGASSGVVAAPCGAPAFAVVLTWVAATQAGIMGFFYLFTFALGMTAILALVGLFSGSIALLPRSGKWMVWIKKGAGIMMIAVAQYYILKAGYNL
jgi:cytochrome c-type biogenesis protein